MRVVLIAEDDPAIQDVLRFLAEGDNLRVVAADNCDFAIREAKAQRPDLAIVDLGLPDRDGTELIYSIRTWSQLPIIVLSARDSESQKKAAFVAGADVYMTKPFSAAELLEKMRELLNGGAPDGPRATV
jgi:two-component system KDP operon response regulator KdpE